MTTDLSKIRLSLKNCEEVVLPYKFPYKCWIKYITAKGEDEAFYEGGEFIRMGHHRLILVNQGRQIYAPTCVRSDDGEILYKSRFFIDPKKTTECISKGDKKKRELEKVVSTQQRVLQKMSQQLKILEDKAHEIKIENYDLRSSLEETEHHVKELLVKEKKYKLILSQYM